MKNFTVKINVLFKFNVFYTFKVFKSVFLSPHPLPIAPDASQSNFHPLQIVSVRVEIRDIKNIAMAHSNQADMEMILKPSCSSPPPAFLAVVVHRLIFFPFYKRAIFDVRSAVPPNALPSFELSHGGRRFAFAFEMLCTLEIFFLLLKIETFCPYSSINCRSRRAIPSS